MARRFRVVPFRPGQVIAIKLRQNIWRPAGLTTPADRRAGAAPHAPGSVPRQRRRRRAVQLHTRRAIGAAGLADQPGPRRREPAPAPGSRAERWRWGHFAPADASRDALDLAHLRIQQTLQHGRLFVDLVSQAHARTSRGTIGPPTIVASTSGLGVCISGYFILIRRE